MSYRLVIAEKPSVSRSIAAVLGASVRKDGCLEGNGWFVSWCFGHLAALARGYEMEVEAGGWQFGWRCCYREGCWER